MSKVDLIYQEVVDKEAKKVLTLTPFQLINFSDYGSLISQTGSKKIKISWWHYKITEDVHHIFFITERRLFLGIYKKYLAGAKLEGNSISLLTDLELAEYD